MRLKEDEAFIHYCETAPEARRNNIYPYVLTKIVDDFKDRKKIFVSVNAKNVASMKGVEKAGFREAKRWKLLVVLGIRIRPFRMLVSVV
jgi:ribosomal protein S18 acetylase RimI-like enzyme